MKRISTYIVIPLLFVVVSAGIFIPFNSVYAEVGTCNYSGSGPIGTVQKKGMTKDECTKDGGVSWAPDSGSNEKAQDIKSNTTCGGIFSSLSVNCIFWDSLGLIGYAILQFMAKVLELGGRFLNYVIIHTIVNFTLYVVGDGTRAHAGMTGINIAWKMARDLMNIAFIFVLVYYAIKMILGITDKSKVYGFISGIVLASLLINFSLFFTKVIIDASNIATIGFYNSIMGNQPSDSEAGLSDAYSKALGLSKFFSGESLDKFQQNTGTGSSLFLVGMFGSVLFLIVAFVFFAISIMLIVRFMVLILLMMFSPVGFMGMALPGLRKYQGQWWDTLIGQCLFAPAFMLMTWVILTLMYSPGFTTFGGGNGNTAIWADLIFSKNSGELGETSPIGLLLNYSIIIGLTIASLTMAKSMASRGSSMVSKFTGQATAFAGGALLGGAAAMSRQSIGRLANSRANNEDLKERAAKGSMWAKLQLKTAQKASGSTFDFRETGMAKQTSKTLGLDLGKGTIFNSKAGQKGYRGTLDEKAKKEEAFAKTLKPSDEYVKQQKDLGKLEDEKVRKEALKAKTKLDKKEEIKKEEDQRFVNDPTMKEHGEAMKAVIGHEKVENKITDLNKEKTRLENDLRAATTLDDKMAITKKIEDTEKEIVDAAKEKSILGNLLHDKREAVEKAKEAREKYKSEELKSLEEMASKTEFKGNELEAENIYANRVGKYADELESKGKSLGSGLWHYTKAVAKTGFLPLGTNVTSKNDNKQIATRIRAIAKTKGLSEKEKNAAWKKIANPKVPEEEKRAEAAKLGINYDKLDSEDEE